MFNNVTFTVNQAVIVFVSTDAYGTGGTHFVSSVHRIIAFLNKIPHISLDFYSQRYHKLRNLYRGSDNRY